MRIAGIVCEYNPIHSGHLYHLEETRRAGYGGIVCVMSGHYVQRGEPAILHKWARAEAAVRCGASLVVELPSVYALRSAEGFAQAAVSLLGACGVQAVSFGSECGDAGRLMDLAALLCSAPFEARLQALLTQQLPYAAARVRAAEELGGEGALLRAPNNNLGVEYGKAMLRMGGKLEAFTVKRQGATHDEQGGGLHISASRMRRALLQGGQALVLHHTPAQALPVLERAMAEVGLADPLRLETALLAHLRRQAPADFLDLPDVSGGLEHRLTAAVREATTLQQAIDAVRSATVTKSRARRIFLRSFLGLTRQTCAGPPDYLRVLAFDRTGRELLRRIKAAGTLPLITKAAQREDLLRREAGLTDLYMLAVERRQPCGLEYRCSPVYVDR
ncbi:MAG: nucleotidyltransferase family protein [Clostridiales bacterium]|nr:nucleotidyltransferase family protein [Clostridiales bacterium]